MTEEYPGLQILTGPFASSAKLKLRTQITSLLIIQTLKTSLSLFGLTETPELIIQILLMGEQLQSLSETSNIRRGSSCCSGAF